MQTDNELSIHFVAPGSVIGQALTDHNDVRKVGFTGSTEVGKTIMKWLVSLSLHYAHV